MLLIDVVRQNLNKTNEEIITYLSEEVLISRDTNMYTIAQIKLVVNDVDALRVVCGTIKAASDADPLVWAFAQKLFSTGLSFADDETQAMIDGLGMMGQWPTELTAAIKRIGVIRASRYVQLGLPFLPSVEDLEATRNRLQEVFALESLNSTLSDIMNKATIFTVHTSNDVVSPAISNGVSLADAKAAVDVAKLDDLISVLNDFKQSLS